MKINFKTIAYISAQAVIDLSETSKQVKQSDGKLQLKLLRTKQPLGSVQVPWRIEPDNNDSVYYDITGLYA